MNKKGYSKLGLFGKINHYDANGKKIGESRQGFFGGLNHYDDYCYRTSQLLQRHDS